MIFFLILFELGENGPSNTPPDPNPPVHQYPTVSTDLFNPKPVPGKPAFGSSWGNVHQQYSQIPQVKPTTPVYDDSLGYLNLRYPPRLPEKPVEQPGVPEGGVYQTFDPSQPDRSPVWPPGAPQGSGYPLVYPTYPKQPGERPGAPQGSRHPVVYPSYPLQPGENPAAPTGPVNPGLYPSYPLPAQNPVMSQGEGHWKPMYFPSYPHQNSNNPAPNPVAQPTSPGTTQQRPPDGQVPQGPLNVPSSYCACPSGLGNCCPQFAFHQHHHHILPVGTGSGQVPPIYSGLPFVPLGAFPGLDNDSGSPASQNPSVPTSKPYFQPPDGSHGANPGGLPVSPHYPNAYVDPRVVGHYWSYPPLSVSQASGENPTAHYHPYMVQPPKGHRSLPGDNNNAPPFFSPVLQQNVANQQPKAASEVQSRPAYVPLQTGQNVSALPRSPPMSRSKEHTENVNASSESDPYGAPGKVAQLFEAPLELRLPGRDRGPSEKSSEDLRLSKEKSKPQRLKGIHTSFPSKSPLHITSTCTFITCIIYLKLALVQRFLDKNHIQTEDRC